jgi:hypothetical protein
VILVSILLLVSAGSSVYAPNSGRTSESALPALLSGDPPPSSHPIQHVVMIMLENEGTSAVDKYGSYERYLGANYGNATEMYSACHGSIADYLAVVSASTIECGGPIAWSNHTNATVGDLIQGDRAANLTWGQFAENLPANICTNPNQDVGPFVVRHVPMLYFRNVTENQSFCKSHVLGSAYFNGTLGAEGITSTNFVNFSFYSPNDCDDGDATCGAHVPAQCTSLSGSAWTACVQTTHADSWLRGFLGPMLNSTDPVEENNVNHTMFIITWDEDGNPTTDHGYKVPGLTVGNSYQHCQAFAPTPGLAVCGGQVYGLVIDHYNRGIHPFTSKDSMYGITATIEWVFNLTGKKGTGLDNVGEFDYLYETSHPGFPTFRSISGIKSNGYPAGD